MSKLVTPAPEFFTDSVIDPDQPSYISHATQKHNRPWLLFTLDADTSIIIPNRSGAMYENYANQYNVSTPAQKHLIASGFDIPQALIIKNSEHELLYDWEKLNPTETKRAAQLKKAAPEVASKSVQFINDYSKFAHSLESAKYEDELSIGSINNPAFWLYSQAPLQYKHEYIPTKYSKTKLKPALLFDEYPDSIKYDISKETEFEEKFGDVNLNFTYVTPLQAKTMELLESQNSSNRINFNSQLQSKFPGTSYKSSFDYLSRGPQRIKEQLDYDLKKAEKITMQQSRISQINKPKAKHTNLSYADELSI